MMDLRVAPVPEKETDPHYGTKAHQEWREAVKQRAGFRCEAVNDGRRCPNSAPDHQMYADHIQEITDGGAKLDLNNGRCLCASHHTKKTLQARDERFR